MVICSGYVLRLLFDRLIFDFVATEFFKYSITPGFEYLDIDYLDVWLFKRSNISEFSYFNSLRFLGI